MKPTVENWKRVAIDEAFADVVRDRRVIVIGPASSIVGARQAERVEDHDIVVRLNNGVNLLHDRPELVDDVGYRCDVLYHNEKTDENPLHASRLAMCGVRVVATCHNRASILYGNTKSHGAFRAFTVNFAQWVTMNGFALHVPGFESYERLSAAVGHPNAGTSAIVDLLDHGAAEVATLGLSGFTTGYTGGYRDVLAATDAANARRDVRRWHDVDKQRSYLRRLAETDQRFRPGPDMQL